MNKYQDESGRYSIVIVIIMGLLVAYACSSDTKGEQKQFRDTEIINEYKVPTGRITKLVNTNNAIIASNKERQRVYQFGKDSLNRISTYGRKGKGPGEFTEYGLVTFDVYKDIIYAISGRDKIHLFHLNEGYKRTISLPKGIIPYGRFTVTDNGITLFRRFHQKPLVELTLQGNIKNKFGKWYGDYSDEFLKFTNNISHIVYDSQNKQYLRIFIGYPFIEFYSRSGKFLNRLNLKEEPLIAERYQYIQEQHEKDKENLKTVYRIFEDVSIHKGKLALLINRNDIGSRYFYTLNLSKGKVDGINRYKLNKKQIDEFETIEFIDDDMLLAFEYETSKIYRFQLD